MWKWQPLDILDVVQGYDRDFTGPHPSIQKGRRYTWHPYEPWSHDASHYDKLNHAHYLPFCYANMYQLPTTHQDVHAEFIQGGFSVQLGSNNPFGRIPVDKTIEETVNKNTQTSVGQSGSV